MKEVTLMMDRKERMNSSFHFLTLEDPSQKEANTGNLALKSYSHRILDQKELYSDHHHASTRGDAEKRRKRLENLMFSTKEPQLEYDDGISALDGSFASHNSGHSLNDSCSSLGSQYKNLFGSLLGGSKSSLCNDNIEDDDGPKAKGSPNNNSLSNIGSLFTKTKRSTSKMLHRKGSPFAELENDASEVVSCNPSKNTEDNSGSQLHLQLSLSGEVEWALPKNEDEGGLAEDLPPPKKPSRPRTPRRSQSGDLSKDRPSLRRTHSGIDGRRTKRPSLRRADSRSDGERTKRPSLRRTASGIEGKRKERHTHSGGEPKGRTSPTSSASPRSTRPAAPRRSCSGDLPKEKRPSLRRTMSGIDTGRPSLGKPSHRRLIEKEGPKKEPRASSLRRTKSSDVSPGAPALKPGTATGGSKHLLKERKSRHSLRRTSSSGDSRHILRKPSLVSRREEESGRIVRRNEPTDETSPKRPRQPLRRTKSRTEARRSPSRSAIRRTASGSSDRKMLRRSASMRLRGSYRYSEEGS